jgi:hypothetical protein
MTGKVYFILVSTFVMGMLTGGFLYVSVFAPAYESDIETIGSINDDGVVIEGQMYGGCQEMDSCASFRIADDRTFTYLEYEGAEIVKGRLPNDVAVSVFKEVGTNAFFAASEEITNDSCAAYVDGLDFTYDISLGGDFYTLDTCTTALAYDEELQALFSGIWMYLEDGKTEYPVIIEEGIGGFVRDRFQNGGGE